MHIGSYVILGFFNASTKVDVMAYFFNRNADKQVLFKALQVWPD